ncbi:SRPBCC family protein [Ornithinibacillus salinisoli]|uniref:SRPBCC family protein n=1 Tax=Ornithinibacillus salinisoli TaxID=1848459 RepID=A0ABW4VYT1_9BACI
MLAQINKNGSKYSVTYERHLTHPVANVWAMFTDNSKLQQWFDELHVEDLRQGGTILFDMGDGTYEEMKITELDHQAVLEFDWDKDRVRFHFMEEDNGCELTLIETINELTEHTPKDLAGWHVCLDVIEALLDGTDYGPREKSWKKWYEKYKEALE